MQNMESDTRRYVDSLMLIFVKDVSNSYVKLDSCIYQVNELKTKQRHVLSQIVS